MSGGSGSSGRLSESSWPIIAAGVASTFSTLVSIISLWTHLKQYRKPIMQRYVVRIMLMVPLYAIASWLSLLSFTAASFIDPIRDVYEAFVIYCFFNLLINYLGGERSIIIMTHGREPKAHPWPLRHFCNKVDISDPYTFLAIKRGILQYAWLKPALALATVLMKVTGTFQEGYIGLNSGYFWSGLLYNVSITLSLYCLAMFWVCLHDDLVPFRPVPKFLVIKLIIFASYWQGFLLSLFVFTGFIKDRPGYSSDNVALATQDLLTCFEMPFFAIAHWYAFSVSDYTDPSIASARLPIAYATRDAFGTGDLLVDTKETFSIRNSKYDYQLFDPGENVMAHGSGRMSRIKEGLRYERGGKGKHWVPRPAPNHQTPLLASLGKSGYSSLSSQDTDDRHRHLNTVDKLNVDAPIRLDLNPEDESLYTKARTMEFGDYNFPVIEVQLKGNRNRSTANFQATTSTHQAILNQAPKGAESAANDDVKGKGRSKLQSHPSRIDEIRDITVEDPQWEERERMRMRREGGAAGHNTDDDLHRYVKLSDGLAHGSTAIVHESATADEKQEGVIPRSKTRVANDFEIGADVSDASSSSSLQNNNDEIDDDNDDVDNGDKKHGDDLDRRDDDDDDEQDDGSKSTEGAGTIATLQRKLKAEILGPGTESQNNPWNE